MMVTADSPQQFDLDRMKRLLGEPVLLGDEKLEDFDEFALAMAASLDPGDMAAHVLVYQYVMETWVLMRLRRLQGHLNRLFSINVEKHDQLAKMARTTKAEAEAFAAQQTAHTAHVKLDFLITQSAKRSYSIHAQIAMYRIALGEKFKIQLDIEERRLRIKETEYLDRGEEELQSLIAEKEAARATKRRPPTQSD